MQKPKFRTVSLKADEYQDFEQLAAELSKELGTPMTVAAVIYMAKNALKKSRGKQ